MKILILINTLGAGGAERSMVEFAKFLHNQTNNEVQFVCLERREIGLEKEVASIGIPVIYYSGDNKFISHVSFVNKIIEKQNPDIIHSVLTQSNLVLRTVRLINHKGNVIQSLVNTPYSTERKKDNKLPWHKFQLAKQIDRWSAVFTSNIFYHAITQEVLNHYKPLFKIKNNYKIIYRGRFENKYVDNVKKSEMFLLVNSGRQEFAKGQIDILKALHYLRERENITDIQFQLLGRAGQYSEHLLKYIEENDLESQVEIPGFINDVEKRLAKADAFIFPSYYEGLGGALIEAFSAKLPCIVSDIPVLKEVVGSEKGALFSPPGDYEKLAQNIFELYKNKKLRDELGNYSYNRFQEAFKMEKINYEMVEMYKDVNSKMK